MNRLLPTITLVLVLFACQRSPPSGLGPGDGTESCSIPESQIFNGGVGRDGIRALTDPIVAEAGMAGADYVDPEDRVIGFVIEDQAYAVPHQVLWFHEIMNLNVGSAHMAVTYCPLTGSSMVFDRSEVADAELGVSGLLFQNNLIMYDRRTEESLWPQMLRGARCGVSTGVQLQMVPGAEMTWEGWTNLHPDTKVPAQDLASGQNFASYRYPYGNYEEPNNAELLFPMPSIDGRRPPKERVLGIPTSGGSVGGGIAFPFGELNDLGTTSAAHGTIGGRAAVVFWDELQQGALAFYPEAAGLALNFSTRDGTIFDLETESLWTLNGLATDGQLAGERLEPIAEAYVAFWFAWAAFHPNTELWETGT